MGEEFGVVDGDFCDVAEWVEFCVGEVLVVFEESGVAEYFVYVSVVFHVGAEAVYVSEFFEVVGGGFEFFAVGEVDVEGGFYWAVVGGHWGFLWGTGVLLVLVYRVWGWLSIVVWCFCGWTARFGWGCCWVVFCFVPCFVDVVVFFGVVLSFSVVVGVFWCGFGCCLGCFGCFFGFGLPIFMALR